MTKNMDLEKIKVSFEMDSVLTNEIGYNYAEELLNRGLDVWIVTSRFDDMSTKRFDDNWDLDSIVKRLDIEEDKVLFTNSKPKIEFFRENDFTWHLDSNSRQKDSINKCNECDTVAFSIRDKRWKKECERLIAEKKNNINQNDR